MTTSPARKESQHLLGQRAGAMQALEPAADLQSGQRHAGAVWASEATHSLDIWVRRTLF